MHDVNQKQGVRTVGYGFSKLYTITNTKVNRSQRVPDCAGGLGILRYKVDNLDRPRQRRF